jgi:hypothetical protein
MAKSFQSLKKELGLLDFIQFGKYKNCRVDSIVDMDDDYLRFMQTQGVRFDKSVIAALSKTFTDKVAVVNKEDDDSYFDDVPF